MERPSLFLAILVVSTRKDYAMQSTMEQEFKTYFSNQVIMEGARSLELLQGLLVFISWYYHRFRLAINAVIFDERHCLLVIRVLDKQVYVFVQLMAAISLDIDLLEKAKRPTEENEETLEIKRTLLGVYYFSRYAICKRLFPPDIIYQP